MRRFLLLLLAILASPINAQVPAFPGAEGFGSIATGGRGGDVYYVTNRNASGTGSFAYGVQNAPAAGRTILFAVSGHIRLPSGSGGGLTIAKDKITVAGQTAPGDGICFWNNTMNITGDDLVFRNVRWRYGYSAAGGDSVDISGSQRIIFDHCDLMFGTDENMSSFGTAPENLTFQWSANAWGLYGHSCGGLWKTKHATVHHTLWANNHTRNPKLIGCDVFDWVNNLSFGWDNGFNMAPEITGGLGYTYRVNVRNSWFVHGGNAGDAIYGGGANDDGTNKFKLYMTDAALDGGTAGTLNATKTNYGMVSATLYDKATTQWPQSVNGDPANPIVGVPVSAVSRGTAYKRILSQVGAARMEVGSRPLRDEITQLLATKTAALQRTPITNPLELNLSTGTAFADLQSTAAPTDTDLDGMPDDWEEAVGYNKAVANHNTVLTAPQTAASFFPAGSPTGYTQLEEYLHFKAVPHGTVAKNTVASPSFIDIDLTKFTSGFTASPVFTVSSITNGSIAQSGPGNAIVRFTPTLETSGRGGFLFTVTDSTGDSWTQQCCLLISTKTQPRPITWIGDGVTNNWDTATANFTSNLGTTAFANGDAVTINDSGSNTPTLKVVGALAPASLTINNTSKNFTLQGTGSLTATGSFTKSGSGSLTISNSGPNTFTAATLEGGTVSLTTANALGTAPITFTAGTLAFSVDLANPLVIDGSVALSPSGGRNVNGSWSGSGTLLINNTGSSLLSLIGGMANFSGNVDFGTSTGSARLYGNLGSATTAFDLGSGTFTLYSRNGGSSYQLGSLRGGPNTVLSGTNSTAVVSTYTIGALDTSTTFDGRITDGGQAAAAIIKTGTGTLTLTHPNSTFSGTTAISTGSLALLGNLTASPVTVAANATLSGTGTMGGSLTTAAGGVVSPGADNGTAAGTLTAASLNLTSPTLRFDLSSNPVAGNDRIQVTGPVSLTGTQNFIFNLTDGIVAPGTYDLVTTAGSLTATGVTFTSNLPTGSRQTLTLEHHATGVRLVVSGTNADLTWTGTNGGLWDQQTSAAWSDGNPATFFNFDTVLFDDTASSGTVTITQPVAPQSITVNNSTARAYTFSGAPITGTTSLVKSGTGSLTLSLPRYDLTNCSITAGSPTVTVSSTTGLVPGMTVISRDDPALIPAGTTIVSVNSATTVTLSQNATATSASVRIIFETRNTFSGGTTLNDGSLTLASNSWEYYSSAFPPPSNPFVLGTGPITLNGGTLTLLGHSVSTLHVSGALPNDLIVPAGKTATLRSVMRGTYLGDIAGLRGDLTGSGTLNLVVNYAYSAITGDWSTFSGTLNVTRATSGAVDPRFQLAHPLGLPLATVSLDQATLSYAATAPSEGLVIPIGSLAGTNNTTTILAGAESGFAPVTWRVGALNTSTTFAGNFTPYGNAPIGLEKTGSGTWTLTGTGTISAGIKVDQGTLSYGDAAADTVSGTSEITVDPAATLQLNSGAKIIGSSCEVFSGGTLRGLGTIQAPLNSSGTVSIIGGTFNVIGNTYLGGTVQFPSFTDRLNITGDLTLDAHLAFPTTGLSFGRKPLVTYTGNLTLGNVTFPTLPSAYLPVLDTSVAGEIAVLLIDNAAYQSWQTTNFGGTASPESQPFADPDNDGMINLEEYQAGTNPKSAASSIPLVWQGGGSNLWDLATTANWLENTTGRVFRDKRNVSITDTGSNSPAINLTGSLQPGSLTVSNSTKAFTLSGTGTLDGPTGLTKTGTNTLTLATSNNYSGPTAINAGIVNVQDHTALGSAAGSTTVANNARLELQGNITVTGETLAISGGGGTSFFNGALNSKSGTNTWTGPVTLAATGTRIGAQAGATLVISGPITSGPGSTGLTVRPESMSATVVLSGANSYAGDTAIIGGVLKLGASNSLPVGTALNFGLSGVSGKLDLAGFNQEIAALASISGTANEITSATPATLTVNTTADSTFAVPITGSAALAKSGPAILTLASAHTYTGPTTVNTGKLLLDLSALATPTNLLNPVSPLTLGGTLELKGKPATASTQTLGNLSIPAGASATIIVTPNSATSANLTLGNTWTLGSGATLLIDLSAGNSTVTASPALTGGLLPGVSVKDTIATGPATVVAGQIVRYVPPTLTVSSNDANSEFSSLNSTYPGGILDWTNGGLLTNRAAHRLILDTSITGGTIDMGSATNVLTLTSGEIQFLGTNDLTLTGGQIGATGTAVSLTTAGTATLTFGSPISGGAGSLSISGTANVILNSASTFTGGLTLNGGTLKQGVAGALGSANGTLTLHSGILDINGLATGLGILTGNGGSITSTTAATLTIGNNNATGGNFTGAIGGNIALTKTGSGTQILSGTNSYTGLTTVSAGILRSATDHSIGNGDLTLNGGTLDLQSFSDTVAALTLNSGNITGTSGLLTATSYSLTTGTISARIGGASATLNKPGGLYTNNATLSGSNTYGGVTTLGTNSGSLILAHDSALGNTPSIDVSGTGGTALVLADGITITGKPITIRGSGANNGTNVGSFGGSLTTSSSATATWTGSVTLGDTSGRLGAGASGTLNITGPILGSVANQNLSLSSGSGSTLGTVVLSGANNFTGNISIVRGSLKLGAANTLPATAIIDVGSASIVENTTFDLNGFSQTLSGLKRTSSNATQISTVTNSSATAATLTLNQPSNLAYSGIITGNLAIAKSGAGTLTLSNTNALAASLSIMLDGGVLSLSSSHTVSALRINGVWQAPGTYTSANSSGRISGTGSLTVLTAGPIGFPSWISGYPGLSNSTPADDPDSDGVSNLLEYVLNGIPNNPNSSILPVPSFNATHFVFTFTQREESAATTTQTFEYGTNLGTWTSVNITSPTGPEVAFGPSASGARSVTISIPKSAAPTGVIFGRLKVLQP